MTKRNWIIVGAIASFLILMCCACVAVGAMWWWGRSEPERTVDQYLTAVRDGDNATVASLSCDRPDAAMRVVHGWAEVIDWEVEDTERHERSAEVTARVTFRVLGLTESRRLHFTLVREDDRWKVCGLRLRN